MYSEATFLQPQKQLQMQRLHEGLTAWAVISKLTLPFFTMNTLVYSFF